MMLVLSFDVDDSFHRNHGLTHCLVRRFQTLSCHFQCKRYYCVGFVDLVLFNAIIERPYRAIRSGLGAFTTITDSFL